ncbi:MAG: hypothetical protein KIG88_03525 [Weeksellaceae bacterium]|nr:hypothetical protein [Weeksellaceae bacterium]
MKNYIYLIVLFFYTSINAQVVIGDENYNNSNALLSVINKNNNSTNSKGILLSKVENKTELPLFDLSQDDEYLDDPKMAGMIMYQKDINRVVLYDGKRWKPTLYENHFRNTKMSMDTNLTTIDENNLPKLACVLIGCGIQNIPFGIVNTNIDFDELKIKTDQTLYNEENYANFQFKESGLYKILVSLSIKTSGLHVTPPVISIRAKKNDFVVSRSDVALNEAILITAGANRTGTMEFIAMFSKGDLLTLQAAGAVGILTVADVYTIMPNERTFVSIEKLF